MKQLLKEVFCQPHANNILEAQSGEQILVAISRNKFYRKLLTFKSANILLLPKPRNCSKQFYLHFTQQFWWWGQFWFMCVSWMYKTAIPKLSFIKHWYFPLYWTNSRSMRMNNIMSFCSLLGYYRSKIYGRTIWSMLWYCVWDTLLCNGGF